MTINIPALSSLPISYNGDLMNRRQFFRIAAMLALGVHESVRRGWLPPSYNSGAQVAWRFVRENLTGEGVLRNTYALWALPAENRDMRLRNETSGWAMGFVLAAANELTL
jgi:hypothetical protein